MPPILTKIKLWMPMIHITLSWYLVLTIPASMDIEHYSVQEQKTFCSDSKYRSNPKLTSMGSLEIFRDF